MNFKEINEILRDTADRMFFKDITNEGDVVLIILENTLLWAVVSKITDEDEEGLREVVIKLLTMPPLEVHYHLTNDQLDGNIPFAIESNEAYIKAVDFSRVYIPKEMKEIYKKDLEEYEESDEIIKVPGSTLVN